MDMAPNPQNAIGVGAYFEIDPGRSCGGARFEFGEIWQYARPMLVATASMSGRQNREIAPTSGIYHFLIGHRGLRAELVGGRPKPRTPWHTTGDSIAGADFDLGLKVPTRERSA